MKTFERPIECAFCGCNQNHILGVTIRHGNDSYKTDREVSVKKNGNLIAGQTRKKLPYRLSGISVVTEYQGECGHKWETEVFTHKGDSQLVITGSTVIEVFE